MATDPETLKRQVQELTSALDTRTSERDQLTAERDRLKQETDQLQQMLNILRAKQFGAHFGKGHRSVRPARLGRVGNRRGGG